MAEESFELRVKRLFGSNLFSTVPDSSFPSSSWSVAGGEVERRLWDRERGAGPDRDDDPCASAFDDKDACFTRNSRRSSSAGSKVAFENDLDDLGDDGGGDDGDREEREIRSFIGLDPTLDREEEEDEYDRAAFHKAKAEERVYMKEINDSGPFMNCNTVLEDLQDDSIEEIQHRHRDPRADHFAASVRLNEDQRVAEVPPTTRQSFGKTDFNQSKLPGCDANVKPILKKRDADQLDSKPKKRVRFDPQSKEEHEEGFVEPQDSPMLIQSEESNNIAEELQKPKESSNVPDYIRNPSKYICYAMDSTDDDDEESNKRAFDDFQKLVRRSNPHQALLDAGVELPKTITFTPRRKTCNPTASEDKMVADILMPAPYARIAAGERDEDEPEEMDEDDDKDVTPTEKKFCSRKEVRQYRSKASSNSATS